MIKRILALLMIFLIIFSFCISSYTETHAAVPIVAYGAYELFQLFIAAGITYVSTENTINDINEFYGTMSQSEQDEWRNSVDMAIGNAVICTKDIWDKVQTYLANKFPEVKIYYNNANQRVTNIQLNTPYDKIGNISCIINNEKYYRYYDSGVFLKEDYLGNGLLKDITLKYRILNMTGNYIINGVTTQCNHVGTIMTLKRSMDNGNTWTNETLTSTITAIPSSTISQLEVYNNEQAPYANVSSTVQDLNYDWVNLNTQSRAVKKYTGSDINQDIGSLANKTQQDIQNQQLTTSTTYPNTWTGRFIDAYPGMITTWTFSGAGTIVGDVTNESVGTWTGTWGRSATGSITFTGTYTDAQTRTWQGTALQTASQPIESSWQYTKWKVPPDFLKNKFPFCIPWDITNAFKSLLVTPQAPKWTIKFDSRYFVGGASIDIDFTMFEIWAKIVRWAVLIIFNIGLILATRRLIGAS